MSKSKKKIKQDNSPNKELLEKKYHQAQPLQKNGHLNDAKKLYEELLEV